MKTKQASPELLEQHYKDLVDKPFFPKLKEYMLSGPVVCMVWEVGLELELSKTAYACLADEWHYVIVLFIDRERKPFQRVEKCWEPPIRLNRPLEPSEATIALK